MPEANDKRAALPPTDTPPLNAPESAGRRVALEAGREGGGAAMGQDDARDAKFKPLCHSKLSFFETEELLALLDGEPPAEEVFFTSVLLSMWWVAKCFQPIAANLINESHRISSSKAKWLCSSPEGRVEASASLVEKCDLLLMYCDQNCRAVCAVLDEYDRKTGTDTGSTFKEACKISSIKSSAFFASPLINDIKAVGELHKLAAAGHEPSTHNEGCPYGDLTCSVCLDLLSKPVSLGCGHTFCHSCVLSVAGREHFDGLSHVPSSVACPLCRRLGVLVFPRARKVPEVENLIRTRFPTSSKRRDEENDLEPTSALDAELRRSYLASKRASSQAHGVMHAIKSRVPPLASLYK